MDKDCHWYLVQCKPREGFRAERNLAHQGYTCFHPTHQVKRKVAGRLCTVVDSLFPHYLFIALSPTDNCATIRSTRGVSRLVSFNGVPAAIDAHLIEALKLHCRRLHEQSPQPLFKTGDRVTVSEGCFKTLEAVVSAPKGEDRVILLLSICNRPQTVELPVTVLKKVV